MTSSNNQTSDELLQIVHLCACQCMSTDDLERVERLEAETVKELASWHNAKLHSLLEQLPKNKKHHKDMTYGEDCEIVGFNQALTEVEQLIQEHLEGGK